jgi:hypothetical protein
MLMYGRWSVGKTRTLATSPKPMLIIRSPMDHVDSIIGTPGIEEWVVRDWTVMDEVKEFLRLEGKRYKWVWWDCISLWQDTGLADIWDATVLRKPGRKEYGLDKGEYGRNMERITLWVMEVVSTGQFNFGITAHPFTAENPQGDLVDMPYIQGKNMATKICGYMNVVAYLDRKPLGNGKFRTVLYTEETEDFYAKDQFNSMADKGGKLINPTVPKLMEAIDARRQAAAPRRPRPRRKTRRA